MIGSLWPEMWGGDVPAHRPALVSYGGSSSIHPGACQLLPAPETWAGANRGCYKIVHVLLLSESMLLFKPKGFIPLRAVSYLLLLFTGLRLSNSSRQITQIQCGNYTRAEDNLHLCGFKCIGPEPLNMEALMFCLEDVFAEVSRLIWSRSSLDRNVEKIRCSRSPLSSTTHSSGLRVLPLRKNKKPNK